MPDVITNESACKWQIKWYFVFKVKYLS